MRDGWRGMREEEKYIEIRDFEILKFMCCRMRDALKIITRIYSDAPLAAASDLQGDTACTVQYSYASVAAPLFAASDASSSARRSFTRARC